MDGSNSAQFKDFWLTYAESLPAKASLPVPKLESWLADLCARYSESQRHYHTLTHIEHMFQLFNEHKSVLKRPELVAMAVWFHDVVYDPTKGDNEEKSDELWRQFCTDFSISEPEAKLVSYYILSTKSHKIAEEYSNDSDLKYFMDFDLAILGSDESRYKTYAKNIRLEYSWVPTPVWTEKRPQVLRSLMEGRVYFTDHFFNNFDHIAKQNMQKEIDSIQSGDI